MDFHLFEEEDVDDDLFRCAQFELTQNRTGLQEGDCVPEFQCSGEDRQSSDFSNDGFVKSGFITNGHIFQDSTINTNTLSDYEFTEMHLQGLSTAKYLFEDVCMAVQYLTTRVHGSVNWPNGGANLSKRRHRSELNGSSLCYQQRRHVTEFLYVVLHTTNVAQWPLVRQHMTRLRKLINRITDMDGWRFIYFATSLKGNACNLPAYHLLHGVLEWKLLDMCILYKYELPRETEQGSNRNTPQCDSGFHVHLERLLKDLLLCSLHVFIKHRRLDLLASSPFPCTCYRELWLLLQLALERWKEVHKSPKFGFWDVFNRSMAWLKTESDVFNVTPLGFCEFGNWMLHSVSRLHGYRPNGQFVGAHYKRALADSAPNYEFLELCTRDMLQCQPTEETLRIFIVLLMPTLLDWWPIIQVGVPMLLWEYFHKRLNHSFFLAGTAPDSLAVACGSGREYLQRLRDLLSKSNAYSSVSSYTLFILLLGKILDRLKQGQLQRQAQKLLGRIYSKFSAQKFLTLNETGLHHLIELFIVLLLCGEYDELAPKVRDHLLSVTLDKGLSTVGQRIVVARGHAALLILSAERQQDMTEHVRRLLQQLMNLRNELAVARVLGDTLLDIYELTQDFERGEVLLIEAWLPNLLSECSGQEQDRVLEAIHLCLERLLERSDGVLRAVSVGKSRELLIALQSHVLPFVKQQYARSHSRWLPALAAQFCIHAPVTACSSTPITFEKLFAFFVDASVFGSRQYSAEFVLKVLCSDRASLVGATVVIQVWLKSLVLLGAVNESVAQLGRFVIRLTTFRFIAGLEGHSESENEIEQKFLRTKEPLCMFVSTVGRRYDACGTDFAQRCQIADQFNGYVRSFERWLQTNSEERSVGMVAGINFAKLENTDVVYRFYSFLAIVIYNCPSIVYTKAKMSCFFHVAMTRFILPTGVLMNKSPEPRFAQLMHKIWPVLVQGVGRLSFKSDAYVAKTLTDLVQKWTPHFKLVSQQARIVARPFVCCLQADNEQVALYVFEKLTAAFLGTQRRQADPHACLVVTIFQEVIDVIDHDSSKAANGQSKCEYQLERFMNAVAQQTLEHIMMVDEVVPSRVHLLEMFRRLTASSVYSQSVRLQSLLTDSLRRLTSKHLAYYTFYLFDLLTQLAHISPTLVAGLMAFLGDEVRVVELKRGSGPDQRMRDCLHKLQACLAEKTSD